MGSPRAPRRIRGEGWTIDELSHDNGDRRRQGGHSAVRAETPGGRLGPPSKRTPAAGATGRPFCFAKSAEGGRSRGGSPPSDRLRTSRRGGNGSRAVISD